MTHMQVDNLDNYRGIFGELKNSSKKSRGCQARPLII
jgi:hypothetical protein